MPRLSMRPVRVTSPAPRTTPRMPIRGRVETSDGIAAAAARAMFAGVGRTAVLEAAIIFRLPSRPDSGNDGKSGAQFRGESGVVQHDLDRDALHDLGEIAGRIVRRTQRKLRAAGRSNLKYLAVDHAARIFVDANLRWIANFDISELRLAIVRLHPFGERHEGDDLCSRRNQLTRPHLPFTYGAISRRLDSCVAEVHLRQLECRLLGM